MCRTFAALVGVLAVAGCSEGGGAHAASARPDPAVSLPVPAFSLRSRERITACNTEAGGARGRFGAAKDDTIIVDKAGQAVRHFRGTGQITLPADVARLRAEIDRLR
ncbi:MAG: hypothetical protein HY722_15535 [Planctomycetes bacterium]|nr:hypothetical protein [Planctomycetota bacterium]